MVDFDNDGDQDLYVSAGAGLGQGGTSIKRDFLYINDGTGSFTDMNDVHAELNQDARGRMGVWFDYDGDGDLDLFQKNFEVIEVNNRVYLNDGDQTFTEISSTSGLAPFVDMEQGSILLLADFNGDGLADLFVSGMGSDFERQRADAASRWFVRGYERDRLGDQRFQPGYGSG